MLPRVIDYSPTEWGVVKEVMLGNKTKAVDECFIWQ